MCHLDDAVITRFLGVPTERFPDLVDVSVLRLRQVLESVEQVFLRVLVASALDDGFTPRGKDRGPQVPGELAAIASVPVRKPRRGRRCERPALDQGLGGRLTLSGVLQEPMLLAA